jgi:hypothetical protein
MMSRFAITPEALAEGRCSSTAALELCIGCLNDLCRTEGIFIDMRNGDWGRATDIVGPLAKRFLTFARKNRRLIFVPPQLPNEPDDDEGWLWEAQKFHATFPCRAIITNKELAEIYKEAPVVSIERVNQTSWWEARSASRIITRTTAGYLQALDLISRHANSLMFIDPYIDPKAFGYREFPQLLLAAGATGRRPLIEIHRASWRKIAGKNDVQQLSQWRADFDEWSQRLAKAGLKATVFLWEKMHDRFLITDLAGISVPYGFDISNDPLETSTWSRLGVNERDQHQKGFDPACGVHGFVHRFEIGKDR